MDRKSKLSQQDSTTIPNLLNPEEIAARRIPIEDAELNLGTVGNWHCHYCNRRFKGENVFLKHYCEPKRRAAELLSPLGQAAFGYYREWMRLKKFSVQGSAAFVESKYYRSFINFAQMIINAGIARPDKYIELMVAGDILPILWCRESAYAVYLQWNDKLSDPIEQVQSSVNCLLDICEKETVQLEDVFKHLGVQQILSLVRQRQLSPWLLFNSAKFGIVLKTFDQSQLIVFNNLINSEYWANKFQTELGTVSTIKNIVKEIGL